MARLLTALLLVSGWSASHVVGAASGARAQGLASDGKSIAAPPEKKPAEAEKKPAAPSAACTLLTTEGPRGGRLEVEGHGFGKAPLVRIAGRVTRMIERTETRIAVQIPRDSDGGPVTVKVAELEIACGTLDIIGKN
jgi:hypothetical protein